MNLKEYLSEKQFSYYSNLNTQELKNITPERFKQIEDIAIIYINFHFYHINNNPIMVILQKILENVAGYNTLYFEVTEGFGRANEVNFNTDGEVLLFIILVIDREYKMAKKHLSFIEQNNSKAKALIMHKQYAKKYNSFFDSKILQGELILLEREKELNNQKELKRKRTINR